MPACCLVAAAIFTYMSSLDSELLCMLFITLLMLLLLFDVVLFRCAIVGHIPQLLKMMWLTTT